MFVRALRREAFCVPIILAFLLFSTFVWNPQSLIVPVELAGFVDNAERTLPLLLLPLFSFLLPDSYEIELSLVCGVRTTKLAFGKMISRLLYVLVCTYVIILCYRYRPFNMPQYRPMIPIYVPEHFKWYLVISFTVTILFFVSLIFLVRIITRNCYVTVPIGLFFSVVFDSHCKRIQGGLLDVRHCLIDPFISVYMLGDEVPNAYAARYAELSVMQNAWTCNRLLFLVLAALLFLVSYLLLRREKLHKTFGD